MWCLWAEGSCAQILLVQQCWSPLEACPLHVPMCVPVLVPPQLNSPMNSVTSTEDIKPPLGLNGVLKVPAHPSGTMASFTKHICAICGDRSSGEFGVWVPWQSWHCSPLNASSSQSRGWKPSQESPGPCLAGGSHPHPIGKQGLCPHPLVCTGSVTQCHMKRCS